MLKYIKSFLIPCNVIRIVGFVYLQGFVGLVSELSTSKEVMCMWLFTAALQFYEGMMHCTS